MKTDTYESLLESWREQDAALQTIWGALGIDGDPSPLHVGGAPGDIAERMTQRLAALNQADQQREQLRTALVKLIGASEREELEQLEAMMRLMPGPAEDKAAAIDGIHALLAIAGVSPEKPRP